VTMEDIKSNATTELRKIPKEAFHWCFQQWQDQWSKCARDYVSIALCPTLAVLCHHSWNFLTVYHVYIKCLQNSLLFLMQSHKLF
jgi:hypothetical protein